MAETSSEPARGRQSYVSESAVTREDWHVSVTVSVAERVKKKSKTEQSESEPCLKYIEFAANRFN